MLSKRFLLSIVFLTTILTVSVLLSTFSQSAFGAGGEKIEDKDKKSLIEEKNQIQSLKGLEQNETRVFVFYKNDIKQKDISNLDKKGAKVKIEFSKMRAIVVHVNSAKLKELQADPNVERIVEDQVVHASLDLSVPQIGANMVYASGITGQGTKVCVVDTGVDDTHPMLNQLIAEHDFVNNDNDATDDNGHGTHVAGIIASKDSLYRGVAPGSSLMAAKVLDNTGTGTTSGVVQGINWCVSNGADVINLSLGGGLSVGTCDANPDAMEVNNAVAAGVVVVSASGNNGRISQISSPACASGAIAVGAVDDFDGRTAFSNEGSQLAIVAPGVTITSLKAPINGGGFTSLTGTSMATPHVAGLAALILDKNLNLTPTQVRTAIQSNALDLGTPGFDTIYGYGRIRAINSVNSVLPDGASASSSTGTGVILLSSNIGGVSSLASVSESSLPTTGKPSSYFPHGLTSWTVTNLTPGQTVTVTLTYPTNIPAGSKYWKVISGSWVDATSIVGDNDGDNTLTLTITDGGPFDSNPTPGQISDPGGPAVSMPTLRSSVNIGGSGTKISLSGTSFMSGSTVTIKFDSAVLGAVTATGGSFNAPIAIPSSIPGIHTLSATDGTNTLSSKFLVLLPRITATQPGNIFVTTNSATLGANVDLYLKGFTGNDPSKTITISVDGVPTGLPISPNKIGNYKAFNLSVPSALGQHTISATDGLNSASMIFYIIP